MNTDEKSEWMHETLNEEMNEKVLGKKMNGWAIR